VLFVKWSRFSRDHAGAMGMIQELRSRGIECQATEQPIDWSVPEQGLMLAFYVAAPQVENERRALNTQRGMRQAKREGRWVATPPIGYEGARSTQDGKQRLEADWGEPGAPGDADRVRQAFEWAAERRDLSLEQIRRRIDGLRISRSRFPNLLKRVVYTGRIKLKAWRGEPEEIVEGLHEAIISKSLYRRVQAQRFGEERPQSGPNRSFRPQLPLRGHLMCPDCGEPMTGSRSKGRGKYYWYYHCQTRGACTNRYSAPDVNDALPPYLDEIEMAGEVQALYERILDDLMQSEKAERAQKLRTLEEKEEALQERLFKADEALVEG
jgi:DNA invertase Pin-like site-specific DNA recombinase